MLYCLTIMMEPIFYESHKLQSHLSYFIVDYAGTPSLAKLYYQLYGHKTDESFDEYTRYWAGIGSPSALSLLHQGSWLWCMQRYAQQSRDDSCTLPYPLLHIYRHHRGAIDCWTFSGLFWTDGTAFDGKQRGLSHIRIHQSGGIGSKNKTISNTYRLDTYGTV